MPRKQDPLPDSSNLKKLLAVYHSLSSLSHESLKIFQAKKTSLPTVEDTGLSARTVEEANKAVKKVLTHQPYLTTSYQVRYSVDFNIHKCSALVNSLYKVINEVFETQCLDF